MIATLLLSLSLAQPVVSSRLRFKLPVRRVWARKVRNRKAERAAWIRRASRFMHNETLACEGV